MKRKLHLLFTLLACSLFISKNTYADTIDPATFSANLELGESVTITKTVTIDNSLTYSGLIDVMFLIDTSGSMGAEISAAKTAASSILSGLSGFGDLATGVGYYSEPGVNGLLHNLSTDDTTAIANINSIYLGQGGGGGDFPELGVQGVEEAAAADWREGSSRFIIALGDASFKELNGYTTVSAVNALNAANATFVGIDYGSMTGSGSVDPITFANASGGSIIDSSGLNTANVVSDIISGIESAFFNYSEVTVGALGANLPGVSMEVSCLTADTGTCNGAVAEGSFERDGERTFTFEVTFTGEELGTHEFETYALVDDAIVASEADSFTVASTSPPAPVPEPKSLVVFALFLLAMKARKIRKG